MLVYYFGLKRGDDKMLDVRHPRRLDLSVILHQHQSLLGIHHALGLKNIFNQVPTTSSERNHSICKKTYPKQNYLWVWHQPEGALLDTNYRRVSQLLLWVFYYFLLFFFSIYKECVMCTFKASGGNFTCILTKCAQTFPAYWIQWGVVFIQWLTRFFCVLCLI